MVDALYASLVWWMPAALLGSLATFIDIDSFFRSKRTSYTVGGNIRCYSFLALNGALSAGLVIWAIESDANSMINIIIHVEPSWAKAVVIAFGVPLILRSKLFSFGDDQTPAGPAIAYDWLRLKVLYDINNKSAIVKDRLSDRLADRLTRGAGAAGLPARVKSLVDDYVKPFATPLDLSQLQKEFDAIQTTYTGAGALTADHFRNLIRWARDNTSINYVERRLAS